ncbi:MAG: aldo/keto reductase [Thermodesulfobacteriota bacterium]
MLYRRLGKTGFNVSILGFGCMRLPVRGSKKEIDEEETFQMVGYAMDHGINYFDTAYSYHEGKSEVCIGKALKGHRDQVMLATKLPIKKVKGREDFPRFLDEQLRRLDTDHLDVYLLHGVNRQVWHKMKALGVLQFLDQIRAQGLTRYVGFSFHDDVKIFKEIVDSYDWTLCQIQYNYFDEHYQAGREGMTYAVSKGLGVVVMEPLRGGQLTDPVPAEVQSVWNEAEEKRSPAEWGLRWVWNQPEVSTVLSGMSSMGQLMENVRVADHGPGFLSKKDLSVVQKAKEIYKGMLKIGCTGCAYCMPCPNGVNIPMGFTLYNDLFMFKKPERTIKRYNMTPEQTAAHCTECGECEEQCPQHLKIIDELKTVHQTLGRSKS